MDMELLSPAGSPACALAAFDAGADAVYAGLSKFNARERGENFTPDMMKKIVDYAHAHSKKVYLTLNTLLREAELPELLETLDIIDDIAPDGVLVQDLGVLRLAREYYPDLILHGSTQMGFHNSAGLQMAEKLGLSRVVLERQITMEELAAIRKQTRLELEVFVHGSLCCSLSGVCLFSSYLGGWSGNRGKCKQPCRRRYHSDSGNGFFLSSQDLCTLDILPEIMSSGVSSLKIEGRLRRADYVQNVVSAYRLAMDAASDPAAFRDAVPKARELLAKTCGRKWSLGFYTEKSRRDLIKFDALGASGQLCGKVVSTAENGFTVLPSRRLHLGDVIRVQPRSGDEGPAVTITRMTRNGRPVSRALKDESVFIHSDKAVARESLVYKTGESVGDYSKRIAAMPLRRTLLDLDITLNRSAVTVRTVGGGVWTKDLALAESVSRPLTDEVLIREFSNTNTETLETGRIRCHIADSPFLPASVLKALRKEFALWLEQNVSADDIAADNARRLQAFRDHHRTMHGPSAAQPLRWSAIVPRGKHPELPRDTAIIRVMKDDPSPREELLLPFFIREKDLATVRDAIGKYIRKGGSTVRITSVHHLALLKEYAGQIKIRTCMPLPVCNSMAAEELMSLGVSDAQAWIELGAKELEELAAKSPLPLEQYRFGRPVLLATHAVIPAQGVLTDARGNEFQLAEDGDLTLLTAGKIMEVPQVRGIAGAMADHRFADHKPGRNNAAIFNFDCGLS